MICTMPEMQKSGNRNTSNLILFLQEFLFWKESIWCVLMQPGYLTSFICKMFDNLSKQTLMKNNSSTEILRRAYLLRKDFLKRLNFNRKGNEIGLPSSI